jgi:hypothetical protein
VHSLWFYKHQHDNRVRSKLFVTCQRWWFQWQFAAILVNCTSSGEMHNYCTPHIITENYENFLIHRCNYILLSQVYCAWEAVKTPTIIFNKTFYFVASYVIWYDKIYLTTIGQPPGGSCSVHIYTQTIQGKSQNKHHIEKHKKIHRTTQKMHRTTQKIYRATKKLGRVRAVLRLCGHHPGICLKNEKKARKKLSQGSHT